MSDILMVREFADVFLEEVLGLPLVREVEFRIDVLPGTMPIPLAIYWKTLLEFRELKTQDGNMKLCIDC